MRVGIVNDLALACEVLRRLIAAAPGHAVAWIARDGAEAVRMARDDPADVVLMDLIMPGVDGVEATRRIMRETPCPILVVTSSVSTNFSKVYEAMGHGAMDAVDTPLLGPDGQVRNGEPLLTRLANLERERTAAPPRPALSSAARTAVAPAEQAPPILALGASTGGPDALIRVLRPLPLTFPAAVLIVQHIAPDFAPSLAAWLRANMKLAVRIAKPGDRPEPGHVLLAASNDHLVVRGDGRLDYTADPPGNPFRPSADVLFDSLAAHWPRPGVAALLTGMGHDGAAGLLRLRHCGWFTVAQDRASSVVFGMPRAAIDLGAACETLPLDDIGPVIHTRLSTPPAGRK